MKLITDVGTDPVVVHVPGNNGRQRPELERLANLALDVIPDDRRTEPQLTLITWNNTGQPGLLEQTARLWGVEPVVLGEHLADKEWKNTWKLGLTADFLEDCPTPFVMGADSRDFEKAK